MSLFPYLFIGVGGTGGKTVGMIHYHLSESLKRLGIMEMPLGWQFLHVDVASRLDARTAELHYTLPATAYLPLTTTQSTYFGLDTTISQGLTVQGLDRHLAWESWRPQPPEDVRVTVSDGAGQFRTVGRVAAINGLGDIRNAVGSAMDRVRDGRVQGELDLIERALGRIPNAESPRPSVLVFGSVAGGSGSGMLLDVCDVVRGLGVASDPDAIVFTPEVFKYPDGSLDPGVAPNTFLAMCELANAMWTVTQQHPTVGRDRLFERAGVSKPDPAKSGGPGTVYLVGKSSEGVTLASADEVYAVVARSFAEVALDPSLSNQLRAYGSANAQARAEGNPDFLKLSSNPVDLGTFGALGFGRVSLGREFFDRYTAQRFMRMAALRLLDQHLTLHTKGDGKTDEMVLQEAVERAFPKFLAAAGLSEVGEANDVVDALNPLAALEAKLSSVERLAIDRIVAVAEKDRIPVPMARAEAASFVNDQMNRESDTLWTSWDSTLRGIIDSWAKTARDAVSGAVVAAIAEDGLPVAKVLLERLDEDIAEAIGELSGRDLAKKMDLVGRQLDFLRTGRQNEERTVRVGDALVSEIAAQVRSSLVSCVEAWTLVAAARVLADARENLVAPWIRAVTDADAHLRMQARPYSGQRPLDLWPGSAGVPRHLRPSRVEFLIDDIDQFPEYFMDVIPRSIGGAATVGGLEGANNAVEDAVSEILVGSRLGLRTPDSLLPAAYPTNWMPADGVKGRGMRAVIKLRFTLPDLEKRVHAWLHDDTKPIGRYITETWREFLEDPSAGDGEIVQRKNRIAAQFTAALAVSKPLVKLNGPMVQKVHNINVGSAPITLVVSSMNVPTHMTDLRERLQDAAQLAYGPLARLSFVDRPTPSVMIFSTFSTPYHALEVDSIMEPVATQYASLHNQVDFWRLRRARALTDWVPLGPESAQRLVTGWLAARCLGRAYVDGDHPITHHVYIDPTPGGGESGWVKAIPEGVRFPTAENQIGILLEMVAMSLLHAYQAGSLSPLAPFQELIRLGSTIGSSVALDPIRHWVATGLGIVEPTIGYFPEPLATPQDRIDALKSRCDRIEAVFAKYVTPAALSDLARSQDQIAAEVYPLVQNALVALRRSAVPPAGPVDL